VVPQRPARARFLACSGANGQLPSTTMADGGEAAALIGCGSGVFAPLFLPLEWEHDQAARRRVWAMARVVRALWWHCVWPQVHADEGQRAHRTLTLLRAFQYGHWLAAATRPVF